MVAISSLLVAGGLLYSGTVAYRQLRAKDVTPWLPLRRNRNKQMQAANSDENRPRTALQQANRTVALTSVSLGLTTVGVLFKPIFVLVSVPVAILIFAPTFRSAYQMLRHERRVATPVLDTVRITLCIFMGYYVVLALDTWFRSLTERLLLRSEEELNDILSKQFADVHDPAWVFADGAEVEMPFEEVTTGDVVIVEAGNVIAVNGRVLYGQAWLDERVVTGVSKPACKTTGDSILASTRVLSGQLYIQVEQIEGKLATTDIQKVLQQAVKSGTYSQQFAERSGAKSAPRMLALFALALPFWADANRAAGFLTTSFGAQMGALGPYTLQNFINLTVRQGILIKDGRVLEVANLINTIVFDARILSDPIYRAQAKEAIHKLRQRKWPLNGISPHRFAIYVLSDRDKETTMRLADELGFDDYFVEPLSIGRAGLVEQWQTGGRTICYVGDGVEDALVMEKAQMSVSMRSATSLTKDKAQVVLFEKDLNRLIHLFDCATQFTAKQAFNLAWPLLMDIVDIITTVFIHFGLTYSVLFSYSGMLISAANARLPLVRYQRAQASKGADKLLPYRPTKY